jgi:hypothetical protein
MTAFSPLLGRLINQTILTHSSGQLLGILTAATSNVRTYPQELLDSSVQFYKFRVLSPFNKDVNVRDTVKVAQSASGMVAVGDILKVTEINVSPYTVVTDKTGWLLVLASDTVKYMQ